MSYLSVDDRLAISEAVDHAAKDADASLPVSAEAHGYVWEVVTRIVAKAWDEGYLENKRLDSQEYRDILNPYRV